MKVCRCLVAGSWPEFVSKQKAGTHTSFRNIQALQEACQFLYTARETGMMGKERGIKAEGRINEKKEWLETR